MDEQYRWTDETLDALHNAGVDWRDVLHVLHAHPRVRRHLGAVLNTAAPARNGQWLAVAAIEEADDNYLIVGARWLDQEETESTRKMLTGGQP